MNIKLGQGNLEEHQRKYYWLRNSYGHTQILDVDWFKQELDRITEEGAKQNIRKINNHIQQILKRKKERN